jgi:hypothetical protein
MVFFVIVKFLSMGIFTTLQMNSAELFKSLDFDSAVKRGRSVDFAHSIHRTSNDSGVVFEAANTAVSKRTAAGIPTY